MGIISWIVLGGIAGWLASIITKRNDQMGCITNIITGILTIGTVHQFVRGTTVGFPMGMIKGEEMADLMNEG